MVEVRGSNGAFYKVTGYRTGPVLGLLPSLVSRATADRPRWRGGRGGLGVEGSSGLGACSHPPRSDSRCPRPRRPVEGEGAPGAEGRSVTELDQLSANAGTGGPALGPVPCGVAAA